MFRPISGKFQAKKIRNIKLNFQLLFQFYMFHCLKITTWWSKLVVVFFSGSKAIPFQAWTGPEGSRRLRLLDFQDSRHMKVVWWSALSTGHLYPRKYSWYSFLLEAAILRPNYNIV